MAQVGSEAKGFYVSWGITFLSFSISFSPTVSSSQASALLTLWLESQSFCFPIWQQGNIYLPQEFIYRRTERKRTHIEDVAHTLQRTSLKRELFPPSECSQIPLLYFHGAAATAGDPAGKWVSPFSLSLSLSTPFHFSEQNDSFSLEFSACPCLEHHFGVHVALRSKLGALGGKKDPREGGQEFTTRSTILGPVCPFPMMPATVRFLDSSGSCSVHTVHILISSSGREGIECTFSVLPGTRTVL